MFEHNNLRRSITEAQLGLEFGGMSKMEFKFEFEFESLCSEGGHCSVRPLVRPAQLAAWYVSLALVELLSLSHFM